MSTPVRSKLKASSAAGKNTSTTAFATAAMPPGTSFKVFASTKQQGNQLADALDLNHCGNSKKSNKPLRTTCPRLASTRSLALHRRNRMRFGTYPWPSAERRTQQHAAISTQRTTTSQTDLNIAQATHHRQQSEASTTRTKARTVLTLCRICAPRTWPRALRHQGLPLAVRRTSLCRQSPVPTPAVAFCPDAVQQTGTTKPWHVNSNCRSSRASYLNERLRKLMRLQVSGG